MRPGDGGRRRGEDADSSEGCDATRSCGAEPKFLEPSRPSFGWCPIRRMVVIQITPQMRVLAAVEPTDFRRGIDGLARVCKEVLRHDPFGGWVFVFRNRPATALKILVYDGQGFWLCHKKLEPECIQIFGFPEIEEHAYNQQVGVAQARRMVGISRKSGPRRSIMPRQGSLSVPPAPCGKGIGSARPTLGAASDGKTAADAGDSGLRRSSATRAASRKGGGR